PHGDRGPADAIDKHYRRIREGGNARRRASYHGPERLHFGRAARLTWLPAAAYDEPFVLGVFLGRWTFMVNRRGAIVLSIAAGLAFSAVVSAQKNEKKQDEAQKKEIQNIVKIVDGGAAGET